ncbi:hypothetical protein E4O04_09805 [Treponema sp. OMZ 799]|uniref:hypothetical protein n=1 Tax=Treponema sp. OMZ 799 TaxID=2563668 RepID=UPI0020A45A16|nr:hypothetical protein [Treponema sp. OMZ 799]UTC77096.1 hypothetical protein E4O04_03375 [Treponema sp. OMZ 799]UTC78281.1 hypothetical protein E4O04_09805 [Treponema sp. OMZ 799]
MKELIVNNFAGIKKNKFEISHLTIFQGYGSREILRLIAALEWIEKNMFMINLELSEFFNKKTKENIFSKNIQDVLSFQNIHNFISTKTKIVYKTDFTIFTLYGNNCNIKKVKNSPKIYLRPKIHHIPEGREFVYYILQLHKVRGIQSVLYEFYSSAIEVYRTLKNTNMCFTLNDDVFNVYLKDLEEILKINVKTKDYPSGQSLDYFEDGIKSIVLIIMFFEASGKISSRDNLSSMDFKNKINNKFLNFLAKENFTKQEIEKYINSSKLLSNGLKKFLFENKIIHKTPSKNITENINLDYKIRKIFEGYYTEYYQYIIESIDSNIQKKFQESFFSHLMNKLNNNDYLIISTIDNFIYKKYIKNKKNIFDYRIYFVERK